MRLSIETARLPLSAERISNAIASTGVASIGKSLFWSLAFGIAYTQAPLYTSNQNTKFLIGLADGGLGFLNEDWLANTIDPFPVFSFLVYVTYRHLPEYMFYFFNILIFGVYLYSMAGIASRIYNIDRERPEYVTFLVVIIALHSYAFDSLSLRIFGIEMGQLLHYGVAEQHMIGRIFQPSVFGVFILLSIYAFLCHKIFLAAFLVALSSIIHPAYVPISAVVTLSYMAVVFMEENSPKKPLAIGIFNLILVSPLLSYYYIQFSPTSPEIWSKASAILVNVRSPHHMIAEVWLGWPVYAKFALTIGALYLVRRTTLFLIMLLPLLMGILLTVAQLLSENATLAAFTPWRISVFLVPLSLGIIVAWAVSHLFRKFAGQIHRNRQVIAAVNFAAILILVLYGVNTHVKRHAKYYSGDSVAMMDFVRETKSSGGIYLVPVELEDFRLYTGAPTFVTFKSGPVKDVEYLEWYKRLVAARRFYAAEDGACKILRALDEHYRITHVIVESAQLDDRCGGNLYQLYRDDRYRVYKIQKQ
ncbi:MAG: DUF6798 domain-containing protein [Candidatus Binatia bacterium]